MKIYKYLLVFFVQFFIFNRAFSEVLKRDTYYFPYLSGSVFVEEKYDRLLDGNNGMNHDRKSLLFTNVDAGVNAHFTNNFSLNTKMLFRPTAERISNLECDGYGNEGILTRDLYFLKNYGFILEEIYFEYKEEYFLAGIGKFNPIFGFAHKNDRYYGIFGQNIVDQYKLTEAVGVFIAMQLPMLNLRLDLLVGQQYG